MKGIFLDREQIKIREIEMTQTPPFISIPEFGEGREMAPGKKLMMAKVTIRLYRLLGFHDSALIYQETPAKEVFAILRKQQIPFSKDSFPEGEMDKQIVSIEKLKEEE